MPPWGGSPEPGRNDLASGGVSWSLHETRARAGLGRSPSPVVGVDPRAAALRTCRDGRGRSARGQRSGRGPRRIRLAVARRIRAPQLQPHDRAAAGPLGGDDLAVLGPGQLADDVEPQADAAEPAAGTPLPLHPTPRPPPPPPPP